MRERAHLGAGKQAGGKVARESGRGDKHQAGDAEPQVGGRCRHAAHAAVVVPFVAHAAQGRLSHTQSVGARQRGARRRRARAPSWRSRARRRRRRGRAPPPPPRGAGRARWSGAARRPARPRSRRCSTGGPPRSATRPPASRQSQRPRSSAPRARAPRARAPRRPAAQGRSRPSRGLKTLQGTGGREAAACWRAVEQPACTRCAVLGRAW